MSRVTRHKHVLKEMMDDDFELPKENQKIVRVVGFPRGNNLHEVEAAELDVENYLVSMPQKYRRNIWVKRGNYLLVDPVDEGNKVKAEICKILTPDHIREFTKAGIWPKRFTKKRDHADDEADSLTDEDADDVGSNGFVVRNLNRPTFNDYDDDDDEESESSND